MNIIVTPRLLLRPFEATDRDAVGALFADPDVMKFIGKIRTPEESEQKLLKMMTEFSERGFGMFAVIDRKEKRFIGRCGLQKLDNTDLLELGYTFVRSAWGKGYATESAKAVLQKALGEWALESVVAVAVPENTASVHVMEKLGMKYDRTETFYARSCVVYTISKKKHIQPLTRPFYEQVKRPVSHYRNLGMK
jgi:ribosomal-protein-alanine N-acetyltransferase